MAIALGFCRFHLQDGAASSDIRAQIDQPERQVARQHDQIVRVAAVNVRAAQRARAGRHRVPLNKLRRVQPALAEDFGERAGQCERAGGSQAATELDVT